LEKVDGTLIILTRNEIEGVKKILPRLPLDKVDEIICIDGKSKDGTVEFLRSKGIRVIVQKKMGRGEAFRIASKVAKHENMVFFSPDGNENPEDIMKVLHWLAKGYDMVIASRFMKGSRADDAEETIPVRSFGNRMFTRIISILWRHRLYDSINGFRGIKRNRFMQINPDAEGFGIEFQVSIRALKLRMKIKEIPTMEGDRIGGASTAHTFSTGWYFIRIILREIFIGKRFLKKRG
jgi:glycosyltransferase involved in cell wall biosynthesis